jgi:hypothetical protein
MASADPGFAVMPLAEDPTKGGIDKESEVFDEQPVAPDQFDPKYETSKWEIWAYYSYYIGNNGLTLFNFAPTAFQNLLSEAAGDAGTLQFAGVDRTINSIVLVSNGISFAIQIVLFLIIGSYAGNSPDVGRVGYIVDEQQTSATLAPISLSSCLLSHLQSALGGWVCIPRINGMLLQDYTSWDVGRSWIHEELSEADSCSDCLPNDSDLLDCSFPRTGSKHPAAEGESRTVHLTTDHARPV